MLHPPRMTLAFDSQSMEVLLERGTSLAIPQTFGEAQPNHFEAPKAWRQPVRTGDFVGDMRQGGSVNYDEVHLVPHCNGTHTETVGHITTESVPIGRQLTHANGLGIVASVLPVSARETAETYIPEKGAQDWLITTEPLRRAFERTTLLLPEIRRHVTHLIIRTLPNDPHKCARHYGLTDPIPYFSNEAMAWILEVGISHLLVDLPSLDRPLDAGKLSNHCIFWGVDHETRRLVNPAGRDRTITELLFVPDTVADGVYWVDLQVAAWDLDAAPSRPIVYPVLPTQ